MKLPSCRLCGVSFDCKDFFGETIASFRKKSAHIEFTSLQLLLLMLRPLTHPMSTTISFVLSRCPKFCLLSMNKSVQKGRPKNRETIPQLRTPGFFQSTTRWRFQTFHQYFSDGWINQQPDKLSGKDSIIFDNLGGLLGCVPLCWGKRPISLPWHLLHKRCSVAWVVSLWNLGSCSVGSYGAVDLGSEMGSL